MATVEPLTEESIRKAYNHVRRDSWEGGLLDAMAHPIRGRLIVARARAIQSARPEPPTEESPKYSPSQGYTRRYVSSSRGQGMDLKSRAAGEREDD